MLPPTAIAPSISPWVIERLPSRNKSKPDAELRGFVCENSVHANTLKITVKYTECWILRVMFG